MAGLAEERHQPVLRWAGSKRKLLPELSRYWYDGFSGYVEPFFGCGALYFHLNPDNAIIGDQNPHLIRLYKILKRRWNAVHVRWQQMPVSADLYYSIREKGFTAADEIEFAANFLYLNRNCFNGLYRTNNAGKFNVPFSGSRTGNALSSQVLKNAASQLRSAEIYCGDFEDLILKTNPRGKLFYLDPPYAIRNKRMFRQYGPDTFGLEDVERLDKCLEFIHAKGGYFLLSYADEPEMKSRYRCWVRRSVTTVRNISGFAEHRGVAKELLVSNFDPQPLARKA